MLNLLEFSSQELSANDLNTVDTNFAQAVKDVGTLYAELYGNFCVYELDDLLFDAVILRDTSEELYYNLTNPARHINITPVFPNSILFPFIAGDNIYVGFNQKFDFLFVTFSTPAPSSVSLTASYWNGSAWASLSLSDGTINFTQNGSINFTIPTDWALVDLNTANSVRNADYNERYYIRFNLGITQTFKISSILRELKVGNNNSSMRVEVTGKNSLAIQVLPGFGCVDGQFVINKSTRRIGVVNPPTAANKWICAICVNKDGEIFAVYGDETAGTPLSPNCPANAIKLADVEIANSDTALVSGDITDNRNVI